ncbi:ABC transporter ATP-binding protein [Ruminococcus sp.]|uniref:ABC transporter ATP-binding protein n=1 Tax=Ruminococcus sp. TaxID=41978 RepID=UPI002930C982|nr:ABC transporter ATP-binding protein [Ruminococcus sp.]MEE1262359.1 ABC transporter ATP-binding protein [Ruminococcus sp.]
MEILRTENLCKTYGSGEYAVHAVNNVSLSVEKGEFVAIVGASGSGKSTLMHLIGGVDHPTSGKIFVDGHNIGAMNADKLAIFRRRQIGIVYQFYNLIPILTAEENIMLPWNLDGRAKDENRLNELLNALNISDKRKCLPNELSGGQQQRVSIARAMINHPALLLCDEPTGNLDSKATEDIMHILRLANRDFHQTIVMITHNLEIAKDADRIIRIQDGKIEEV